MRSVRFNGDIVTQAVNHVAQLEWEWVHGWTVELVKFLLDDAEHGAANRDVMGEWLADWLPPAEEAAQALRPVFDELPAGIPFEDARANAAHRLRRAVRAVRRDRSRRECRRCEMSEETYDYVGIVMAKSAEGDAVAAVLGEQEGIEIDRERLVLGHPGEGPARDRLRRGQRGARARGEPYAIQHEMSTHYGRMVATDDALMLFSDPVEAMEHLSN